MAFMGPQPLLSRLPNLWDLSEVSEAYLSFYTKWDFDRQSDKLFIEANEGGFFWVPLCGTYTRQNAIFGDQGDWVREEVSLVDFIGDTSVSIRLRLFPNQVDAADGIYIDDLKVHVRYNCTLNNWNLTSAVSDETSFGANDGAIQLQVSGGNPPYSYIWSNGDTTQDLSNVGQGDYSVEVIDAYGCIGTLTSAVKGPPVNIDEETAPLLRLGPNPVAEILHIEIEGIGEHDPELRLYTPFGQLVKQELLPRLRTGVDHQLGVEALPNGVYLLEVKMGERLWREKVIVQH